MKKMGRPTIEIDWEEFDKLCAFQCTKEEIAAWYRCSEDTIENKIKETHGKTFSAYFKEKRQAGRVSLRRAQFQNALKGSVPLLIWLGKQYLGQADKLDQTSYTKLDTDKLKEEAKELLKEIE